MQGNPFIGVIFHWLGGLASASFYIPYRGVKRWSWETYWLVGGIFSWIVAPWLLATLLVPGFLDVLRAAPSQSIFWAYFFGAMWGIGGLTFGLTMRYLGIALGMAVALGFCAAFGTLIPPIFKGQIQTLISSAPSQVILAGVGLCLAGIGLSGAAGMSKEREMSEAQKKAVIKEFNFVKGLIIATFSGIMSACMAFGLDAGSPIKELAKAQLVAQGRADLWQNLPVLVVVLAGGFTTNFIWCVILNIRNGSGREYFSSLQVKAGNEGAVLDSHGNALSGTGTAGAPSKRLPVPLLMNYLFSALAGVTWYMQFFFYGMGSTRMGQYEFSSWTLHMASIIIFSTLWGVGLGEWKGASRRTRTLVILGLAVLVGSTVIVGYGNFLKAGTGAEVSGH
ncbi:MAG: L-rhamnose/proton symporter RhaT [Deltaproteobacteria bacterium]|nr:L-rhamnose/proton symporter RhaT [Deltaproteobacteria bacterium]